MLSMVFDTARGAARDAAGVASGVARHAGWWLRHNLSGAARDADPPPAPRSPRHGNGSDER